MRCCHTLQELSPSTSGNGGVQIFRLPIAPFRCLVHSRSSLCGKEVLCQRQRVANLRMTVVTQAKKGKDSDTISALREGESFLRLANIFLK